MAKTYSKYCVELSGTVAEECRRVAAMVPGAKAAAVARQAIARGLVLVEADLRAAARRLIEEEEARDEESSS